MGYDQHQHPNSSGTLVAVIGVGLVLAILAIVVVGGAALFWVGTVRTESRAAVVVEQRAVIEETLRAKAMTLQSQSALEEARAEATPDPRLNFELTLDREGNASVDGEKIGLDELRTRLAKLKDETSNAFSVHIDADSDCLIKQIIPVLEVCEEVGDIDFRIVSSNAANPPLEESDAGT